MANHVQECDWANGANGWGQFTQTDSTRFSSSTAAPVYMGSYGTFRGDSAGNTSGVEQSARIGAFTGSARTTGYASFAFRVPRIQLSGTNGNPSTLNTHRDLFAWAKAKQQNDSTQVTDGGSPAGAPWKLAIIKSNLTGAASSGLVFLEFAASGFSVIRDPTNGMPFDALLGKWLGLEFQVEILRHIDNTQNGFRAMARIWMLETRTPRPFCTWKVEALPGDAIYTPAYFVDDIVVGGAKLKTTAGTDDELDVNYDEFRAGKARVAFPRKLWGGDFKAMVAVDAYAPGSQQDFARRMMLPVDRLTELQLNYRENAFETDAIARFSDPGIVKVELGAVVSGAGQTATTFATDMSWATAAQYFTLASGKECWLKFTSGTQKGQERRVLAWNNSNFYITVEPAFGATPSVGDDFVIEHRTDFLKRFDVRGGTQYRMEVFATDASFRNPVVDAFTGFDEIGPIWWSGLIDTVDQDEQLASRGLRLRAVGISDMLSKSRSLYKVWRRGDRLDAFASMKAQFENFDPSIDLTTELIDNSGTGPNLPFEAYGESADQILDALGKLLGRFVAGIEVSPFHALTGDGPTTGVDYRFAFFESRDEADVSSKDSFIVRSMNLMSPRLRAFVLSKNDQDYANRWKFEGASFVGEILGIVTHRARRDDAAGKPAGFSIRPAMAPSIMDEVLSLGAPTTGAEQYPASFMGWKAEITKKIHRGTFTDEASGNPNWTGGEIPLDNELAGRRVRRIYDWNSETNKVDFRTTKNWPGAQSGYEAVDTTSEALIVSLTPDGRPVERVISNTQSIAALGVRLKHVQSADVIGYVQAGIAAQVDASAQGRARLSGSAVEYPVRERPNATNNRVMIVEPQGQMIKMGASGSGGDGLKVGARNPTTGTSFANRQKYKVGGSRIASLKRVMLTLAPGGWVGEYEFGAQPMTAQDVLARLAKSQRKPGR